MKADLSVYISFGGSAREALTHYNAVLGGDLELVTYGELGAGSGPDDDHIMYGVLRTPTGFVLRGTDRPLQEDAAIERGTAFAVCLNGEEGDLLTGVWERLAETATVESPLETTPWGDANGVLVDPFGIRWIMNIGSSA